MKWKNLKLDPEPDLDLAVSEKNSRAGPDLNMQKCLVKNKGIVFVGKPSKKLLWRTGSEVNSQKKAKISFNG
jgi:hypothetical protein